MNTVLRSEPAPTPAACITLTCADRTLCATLAAWLHAVLQLAALAWAMQAVGLGVWLLRGYQFSWLIWPVILLAVAERWYALRLRLDAQIFHRLGTVPDATLADMQSALHQLGLRKQLAAPRALADMVRGCKRLVACYLACVLALLMLVIGVLVLVRF